MTSLCTHSRVRENGLKVSLSLTLPIFNLFILKKHLFLDAEPMLSIPSDVAPPGENTHF